MSGSTHVTIRVRDRGLVELRRALEGVNRATVEVGVGGEAGSDEILKASVNEFGSDDGHVPERSFLRSTLNENRDKYVNALTRLARKVARGETTLTQGLGLFGMAVQRDVVRKINSRIAPANAPATLRAKVSDFPLIDTGLMRASIRYKVEIE